MVKGSHALREVDQVCACEYPAVLAKLYVGNIQRLTSSHELEPKANELSILDADVAHGPDSWAQQCGGKVARQWMSERHL